MEEKQKKGNGFIIALLLLLILGLAGFIAYDKIMIKDEKTKEINNLKKEINTLKKEKQEAKEETKEETSGETTNTNFINAVYYGFKEDAANNNHPKIFLTLFNDGTFKVLYVDSEGFGGKYEVKDNKLILHRPASAMADASDITYELLENQSKVKTNDGITLQKY